jgi:two-component system sensor histidine kinase YesM
MDSIGKASEKKFNIPILDGADDELSYLANSFNEIVINMGNLVKQIEKEQDLKRKAEIRMLQAQINPHFLFNTLDSLKFVAIMSNAFSVSEGLTSLSKLLRNSIVKENSKITIKEELANIENYLIIQKIRQGDIINFECNIQENCYDMKIMKLLLQPIVENSIIHGLSSSSNFSIKLICRCINNNIIIKIEDNGIGFEKDQEFTEKLNNCNSFSRVGLNNVKERLSLEYKDKQSFKIFSKKNKGTVVIIKYPEEINNV